MRPRQIPTAEIRFAAKMGFLTKSMWDEFFGTESRSWRSRQWRALLEEKFFLHHPSAIAKDVIVPNAGHKIVQQLVGNEVSTAPYAGHIGHDEILSKILIRLIRSKTISDFTSEAELKHRHQDDRHWNVRQERLKFPDAILDVSGEGSLRNMALEIELTAKCQKRYRKIFDTYQDRKQIQAVVFVINSSGIFKALTKAIKDSHYPDWTKPVGFGRVDEWLTDPENAPIRFRELTTSLKDLKANRNSLLKT